MQFKSWTWWCIVILTNPQNRSVFCSSRCTMISQRKMKTLLGNTSYYVFFLKGILSEMQILKNQQVQELTSRSRNVKMIYHSLHGSTSQKCLPLKGTALPDQYLWMNKFRQQLIRLYWASLIYFIHLLIYSCNNYLPNT